MIQNQGQDNDGIQGVNDTFETITKYVTSVKSVLIHKQTY